MLDRRPLLLAAIRPGESCAIGPFRLDRDASVLLRDGAPVSLGRRAVAVLLLLIERPGAVLTKDELITRVWGGLAVEEGNLAAQIAAVRRALSGASGGAAWIETLPRRGYRFTGPVQWGAATPEPPAPVQPLPAPMTRSLGVLPGIAVLAFRTPPPEPVPDAIADGLTAAVVAALAEGGGLCVISLASTCRPRLETLDLAAVGQALGTRYIVSGVVRQTTGRLRIVGELTEAATGKVLLSRRSESALRELGDAPDRLVAEIVRALAARVDIEERARLGPILPNTLSNVLPAVLPNVLPNALPNVLPGALPDALPDGLPVHDLARRLAWTPPSSAVRLIHP